MVGLYVAVRTSRRASFACVQIPLGFPFPLWFSSFHLFRNYLPHNHLPPVGRSENIFMVTPMMSTPSAKLGGVKMLLSLQRPVRHPDVGWGRLIPSSPIPSARPLTPDPKLKNSL